MYDPRKHTYFRTLVELVERGVLPPGLVGVVDVYHDDWCRINHGGYCNCDPEIRLRPPPEWN